MAQSGQMKLTKTALAIAAVATTLGWAAAAQAFDVPPFRGNDTGGIIAYEYALTIDVRGVATDHCAQYNKVPKFLAADKRYGGYISFACVWVRPGSVYSPLRTKG